MLVLATIVAGGYVAGTEKEGTPSAPAGGQAHVACGTGFSADNFPACNGQFFGFGQSRLADIQLVHRALMYLAAIAVLAMVALAIRRRAPSRAFLAAGAILLCQIALGAINVWAGKHAGPDHRSPRARHGAVEYRRLRGSDVVARVGSGAPAGRSARGRWSSRA